MEHRFDSLLRPGNFTGGGHDACQFLFEHKPFPLYLKLSPTCFAWLSPQCGVSRETAAGLKVNTSLRFYDRRGGLTI
jgi:hypothetical protein